MFPHCRALESLGGFRAISYADGITNRPESTGENLPSRPLHPIIPERQDFLIHQPRLWLMYGRQISGWFLCSLALADGPFVPSYYVSAPEISNYQHTPKIPTHSRRVYRSHSRGHLSLSRPHRILRETSWLFSPCGTFFALRHVAEPCLRPIEQHRDVAGASLSVLVHNPCGFAT